MRKLVIVAASITGAAAFTTLATAAQPAHRHGASATASTVSRELATQLAAGRLATAKYVNDLNRAKRDGYAIITRHIPDMGWHFLNPKITGFDLRKPPILVYGKRGSAWQLVAFEWVYPAKPKSPPLPGATYGSFAAACHYKDGTFTFTATEDECAPKSPQTGAAFGFWHPDLVTLHVWVWYPNPEGVFAGKNPLMRPFNGG